MSLAKFTRVVLDFSAGLAGVASGWTQTYSVLSSFTGGADTAFPFRYPAFLVSVRFRDSSDEAHLNSRLADRCKSLVGGRTLRVGAS